MLSVDSREKYLSDTCLSGDSLKKKSIYFIVICYVVIGLFEKSVNICNSVFIIILKVYHVFIISEIAFLQMLDMHVSVKKHIFDGILGWIQILFFLFCLFKYLTYIFALFVQSISCFHLVLRLRGGKPLNAVFSPYMLALSRKYNQNKSVCRK